MSGRDGGGLGPLSPPEGRTAIYKANLQKGGRIIVPDAEIGALGLEPGDSLQVLVYPVD